MKTALEQILAGRLQTVIDRIQRKQLDLNTNSAIKLLIACCTVCSKDEHEICIQDLCDLVEICSLRIGEINETQLVSYLQSIYHFLKYLLKKRDLTVVLQVEKVLFPKFLPTHLTEKQSQICASFSSLIFNEVLIKSKEKETIGDTVTTASIISLKFFLLVKTKTEQFLERVYKFLQVFAMSSIQFAVMNDFFEKTTQILIGNFKNSKEADVVFRLFLSVIRLFVKGFAESFTSEELQKLLEHSLETCREFCETPEHFVYLKIMKTVCTFISAVPKITDLEQSYSDFKSCVARFGLTENVFNICQTISTVFRTLCRKLNKNDGKFWCENYTVKFQLILYKFLRKASVFAEKKKVQCKCCESCKIKNDINGSLSLLYAVGYLFKLSLSNNLKTQELLDLVLSCLETSCTQIVLLKNSACLNWKNAWLETGCIFHNICVVLYNSHEPETLSYYHSFIHYLIKLDGTTASIIKEGALHTALTCFTEACYKHNEYSKAMKMAAFRVFLNPKDCDTALAQWIKVKNAIDVDQNITIVDLLQIAESDIKMLLPTFSLNENLIEEMLIVELEMYKARWPSKIPMLAAFNKLYKHATVLKAGRIFIKIWGNTTHTVAEPLINVLDNLIVDYERTMDPIDLFECNVILACLYNCLYKFKTDSIVLKNSSELKKNVGVIKRTLPPYETPADPNDNCDIVSLCRYLTCESQMKTKQYLDRALEIFEQNCDLLSEKHIEFIKTFEICEILIHIGYEYQLHCYPENCKRLWRIVEKIAEKIDDDLLSLKAKTILIELSDYLKNDCLDLIEKILSSTTKNTDEEKYELLTDFYLTLSQKYLEAQNPNKAYEEFQLAQKYYEKLVKLTENELLKAKLFLVHFKLILLPCNLNIMNHRKDTVVKIHQALDVIKNYFNSSGHRSPKAITLLFEITFTVASWYRWLHLPREVRCYTRDVAVLSQQLVSPLWAARFLALLAYADLLTCRIADCQSNIEGISTILSIPKQECVPMPNVEEKKHEFDLEVVDVLANELKELCLGSSLPKKPSECELSIKNMFKFPAFVGHSNGCDKFCCNSIEYQELAAIQTHLEAWISIYTSDSSREILKYFEGSLNLVKGFAKRAKKSDAFWEIHSNILLDYGNILLKADQKQYAEKINRELLDLVSKKQLSNTYLFGAAQLQRLNLICDYLPANNVSVTVEEEETTEIGTPPKTPESKISHVKIEQNTSPTLPPLPYAQARKKLTFKITEGTTCAAKTPLKTPEMKVPVPAMAETESVRKRRPATATKAKGKNLLGLENVTPCDRAKTDRLRSKTRLLTDKIKRETKTEEAGASSSNRVRKNLMSELTALNSEDVTKKGVVTRKASRNLKI